MKLRDHPEMTRKWGMKVWPPLWVDFRDATYEKPQGEVGYLREVDQPPRTPTAVFLWIEFEGRQYGGVMHFDDPLFCQEISRILRRHIGFSIRDIGDLDLPYTP